MEKSDYILNQAVEVFCNDTPNNTIVNGVVSVDKNVAKGDDVTVIAKLWQEVRISAFDPINGLAHNLKFALNRTAKQFVRAVFFECFA